MSAYRRGEEIHGGSYEKDVLSDADIGVFAFSSGNGQSNSKALTVYCVGSWQDWTSITIGEGNDMLADAVAFYRSALGLMG